MTLTSLRTPDPNFILPRSAPPSQTTIPNALTPTPPWPLPLPRQSPTPGSLCGWNSASEPPCKSKYYSFGVRAALWTLLRDKPGFHIAKRVNSLGQSMVESEFCFTPTGGTTVRGANAMPAVRLLQAAVL